MEHEYFVYITTNKKRKPLYTGVTDNLKFRIWQHKNKVNRGFTSKYNLDRLVWFESHQWIHDAIAREKQIKRWSRKKKITLIEKMNPEWMDLYDDL